MAADKKTEQVNFQVRRDLADGFAYVAGQQATTSFAALTVEELFDQQIERIEGADTQARPNELHRLDAIETNMTRAVAQVKALPADVFKEPNEEDDVNTAPDDEDPVARQKRLTGQA